MLSPIEWNQGRVRIIRQTRLPGEEIWEDLDSVEQVAEAIRILDIRGAPAIGIAAAMGMALAAHLVQEDDPARIKEAVEAAGTVLAGTRPTAVNLFWAVDRMRTVLLEAGSQPAASLRETLLEAAQSIRTADIEACLAIGRHGAPLLPDQGTVITHCNAGALATGGYGTALGVIRAAVESGKQIKVLADETRPLLQGARLTAWELMKDGIDVTLICDNAAGWLMRNGRIQACVVGADRIAANGDAANKIGTYSLAVLARRHGVPFYVAAPTTTVDLSLSSGDQIPIEERNPLEVTTPRGLSIAPSGVAVMNPAFDVTPVSLISGIITEAGVAAGPNLSKQLINLTETAGLRRGG